MGYIALKGRFIDGTGNDPVEKGLILIRDKRIEYAGAQDGREIPEAAEVFEIKQGTILPGFIDCHAHLTVEAGEQLSKHLGDIILKEVPAIGQILDSGFTGVRDMSVPGLYLSRAVEQGYIRGPHILPGGRVMSITSGHGDECYWASKEEYNEKSLIGFLTDGVDECIAGVRRQFREGAKFIKICATGGVSSPNDGLDDIQFSDEELKAIVDEANRHKTYVCAHCTGNEGAYQALKAGVTCIEHGVMLTQREIDLMQAMDATLVTTLSVSLHVANILGLPDFLRRKAETCAEANLKTIEMARKAGIRIALGTDYSNSPNSPYSNLGREFESMVEAGMTPMEAIVAGTKNAAYLMRMETGTLEAGKLADIAVTDGDPLNDIKCLGSAEHIRLVLKSGKIEKNWM